MSLCPWQVGTICDPISPFGAPAGQVGEVLSLARSPRVLPLISLGRGRLLWGWLLGLFTLRGPRTQLDWHHLPPQGDPGRFQRRKGWAGAVWSPVPVTSRSHPSPAAAAAVRPGA